MSKVTRRDFLRMSMVASSGVVLAACQQATTEAPAPTEAPAEQPPAEAPELDLPFEIAAYAVNPLKMSEPVQAEGISFRRFGMHTSNTQLTCLAKVHPAAPCP
jgi:hypothetical protein